MPKARRSLADRFAEKVDQTSGPEGCWPFTGHIKRNGYGAIGEGGKYGRVLMAHRVAYELANGPIQEGLVVDHACFNRACVNPRHLRAVHGLDNNQHRKGANRTSISGVRNVHWYAPYGKWVVRLNFERKFYFGGYYETIPEAEQAAIALRQRLLNTRSSRSHGAASEAAATDGSGPSSEAG